MGATTALALEVPRAATAPLANHSGRAVIVPIVVMIASDPEWRNEAPTVLTEPSAKSGPGSQITLPIDTLVAVGNEHGKVAVAALRATAGPSKDQFSHFLLCEEGHKRAPILG